MASIEIYTATHKKIDFSLPEYCIKIQVNAAKTKKWDGYCHDDEGENISAKNANYCELTALYSMWKNSAADIQGLFHYRRYFGNEEYLTLKTEAIRSVRKGALKRLVITRENIEKTLRQYDMILAVPNGPYPFSVFEDLQRFCFLDDIWKMIHAMEVYYPDYMDSLWEILSSAHISYCNMFIASKDVTSQYCTWLFDFLGKLENEIDIKGYDREHARIYGYFAEILLNVYVRKNRLKCKYFNIVKVDESSPKGYMKEWVTQRLNLVRTVWGKYPDVGDTRFYQTRYEVYRKRFISENKNLPEVYGQMLPNVYELVERTKKYMYKIGANYVEAGKAREYDYVVGKFGSTAAVLCIFNMGEELDEEKSNVLLELKEKFRKKLSDENIRVFMRVIEQLTENKKIYLRNGIRKIDIKDYLNEMKLVGIPGKR